MSNKFSEISDRMEERKEEIFSKDAETLRLQQAFGEVLSDLPSPEETQRAWEGFLARQRVAERRRRVRLYTSGAVAAAVALVLLFGFVFRQTAPEEIEVFAALDVPERLVTTEANGMVTVATPPATTAAFMLDDSTRVVLSANSRLEYPKSFRQQGTRSVRLTGEARFEVARDAARPFIVSTGKMQTQVLGTVFDVSAYPGSGASAVTLYQGCVRVSAEAEQVEMHPGQQVVLARKQKLRIRKAPVVAAESWTQGEFNFDDAPLAEVMQAVGTWYNAGVVFRSAALLQQRIHFRYARQASLEEVLQALNDLHIATVQQKGGKVVVSK
jgi:ferric-dicitrate binding protein FerR (iron transport regulator)